MYSDHLQIGPEAGRLPLPLVRFTTQVTLLALLAALSFGAIAQAGTMKLYSCHTPSGRSVPTYGWSHAFVVDGSSSDTCANGPGGTLRATAESTTMSQHDWTLTAPSGTRIRRFELTACARGGGPVVFAHGSATSMQTIVSNQPTGSLEPTFGCVGPAPWCCSSANTVSGGGPEVQRVTALAICVFCSTSTVEIGSFVADVEDSSAPVASAVGGSLRFSSAQTGAETLVYDAKDAGVGVFRAVAEARIDRSGNWREVASTPVRTGGKCLPLYETDYLFEFAAPLPCPATVESGQLVLERDAMPPGIHELRVQVQDAAGNGTIVLPGRYYTVPRATLTTTPASAPPAPARAVAPGPSPPDTSVTAQLSITSPGARPLSSLTAFRLTGRLLDLAGNPVANGIVAIETRPYFPNAGTATGDWTPLGSAMTDAGGEFRAQIPGGPSRSVQVIYGAGRRGLAPAAVAQANVAVAASITARPRRSRVRNRRSVVIQGRVAGPIPRGGVAVALEVREPDRWIPVATTQRLVRTSDSGAFRLAYRFLKTFRPATYRFRVVADEDSAFPYARGASRPIDIHVRP